MRVAVFLPNWVGDAVMATPTLRALRDLYGPDAVIVGIMRPGLLDLMAGTDWLDESWAFDPRSNDMSVRSPALTRRMREFGFDLAVMMSNSLRCAMICYRVGVPQRIGYAANGRSPLLTSRLYWTRTFAGGPFGLLRKSRRVAIPNVDQYLRLLEPLGCVCPSRRLELATTAADRDAADAIRQNFQIDTERPVIALNPGGAYGPSKLWPHKHFARLAQMIVEQLDHDVLVLCGPDERELARNIVKTALQLTDHEKHAGRLKIVSMADQKLTWGSVKEMIRRCSLMVSTDSGPSHIAAAFGLPVITLLGPTITTWIENPTVRGTHLMNHEVDCLGCYHRDCPLEHHQCMEGLSVDRVFAEVRHQLEHQPETGTLSETVSDSRPNSRPNEAA